MATKPSASYIGQAQAGPPLPSLHTDEYVDEFIRVATGITSAEIKVGPPGGSLSGLPSHAQADTSNRFIQINIAKDESITRYVNKIIGDTEKKSMKRIEDLTKLYELIKETNDKLKQEREEHQTKIRLTNLKLQELEVKLEKEERTWKEKLQQLEEKHKEEIATKQVEDLETARIKHDFDRLSELHGAVSAENIKLKEEISGLRIQLENVGQENRDLVSFINESKRLMNDELKIQSEQKEEIEKLRSSLTIAKNEQTELANENKALREELVLVKEELNKYRKIIEQYEIDMKTKMENLQEELNTQYNRQVTQMERDMLMRSLNPLQNNPSEYDVVVHIDSILDITSGWPIKSSKNFESKNFKDTIVVGIAGLANKGKTFLTNKLCDENFRSGFHVKTEGLSMKYAGDEGKIVSVLDTAGYETPIPFYSERMNQGENFNGRSHEEIMAHLNEDNQRSNEKSANKEKYKDKLNERHSTEDFLQKFILESSNVILIVVGQLTYSDQKLISRITSKFHRKKIVIVHNLHDICYIESVKEKIKTDILEAFDVKELLFEYDIGRPCNKKIWYEYRQGDETEPITHMILARENTEAGDYYNNSTLEHLKNLIKTQSKFQKFDLLDSIVKYSKKNLSQYLEKTDNQLNSHKNDTIEVVYRKEDSKIVLAENGMFKMRTVYFDAFGNLLKYQNSNEYIPDYSLVEYDDYIECILDMPGHLKSVFMDKYVENDKHILIIQGERDINQDVGDKFIRKLSGERKSGRIDLLIQLVDTKTSLGDPRKRTYENGVLKIVIDKIKKLGPIPIELS